MPDDWSDYEQMVLYRLKELECLAKAQRQAFADLTVEVVTLRTKMHIWSTILAPLLGFAAGALAQLLTLLK